MIRSRQQVPQLAAAVAWPVERLPSARPAKFLSVPASETLDPLIADFIIELARADARAAAEQNK